MLQASKTERGMGLAFRHRTTASRTSELDKITPCLSPISDEVFGTRMRLCSLVHSQDSALRTILYEPAHLGITERHGRKD